LSAATIPLFKLVREIFFDGAKPAQQAALVFALVSLLAVAVYWAGLYGPFVFDDEANIVKNTAIHLDDLALPSLYGAASSYPGGILTRPLSMLSFGLNHYFTGLAPFWFKATNIALHLATGLSLFVLLWHLLGALAKKAPSFSANQRLWVSLAVSAAWLLHPLNLTSVLYAVQRMTSLSALFVVWGMILYAVGREQLFRNQPRGYALIFSGIFVFTPLAVLAKENGVLLPLLLLIAEWILWRFQAPNGKDQVVLRAVLFVTVGVPLLMAVAFLAAHPEWLQQAYDRRTFSLVERLLTQTRVIWFYLKLLLFPTQAELTLYHDDIPVSTDLTTPGATLPALVGLLALGLLAIGLWRRAPVFAFGVLFFFAGHALESSFLPLEVAHEHRNYLPGAGILLVFFYYLLHPSLRVGRFRPGYVTAVVLIALFAFLTWGRAQYWGDELQLVMFNVNNHPHSARWHYEAGRVYASLAHDQETKARGSLMEEAREHYLRSAKLDPYQTAGSLIGLLHAQSTLAEFAHQPISAQLVETLENTPVAPIAVSATVRLLECASIRVCRMDENQIEKLLNALFSNPTLRAKDKAKILAASAQYALVFGKYEKALAQARLAVDSDPTHPQHFLNLAYFYYLYGRPKEAKAQIAKARGLDRRAVYKEKIETLEREGMNRLDDKSGK
jgi:hypothetical protein